VAVITVTVMDDGGTANGGINYLTRTFKVTINPINAAPTLDAIPDPQSILEDAGTQTINLSGITAGGGQTQGLMLVATSSNPALVANPSIAYTSPNSAAVLTFAPAANTFGVAVIAVTVIDDGGTANGGVNFLTRTFTLNVAPVNDAPTLGAIADPQAILEDTGVQTINFGGISAGPANEAAQTLSVTATSSNPLLIPNPAVVYNSPDGAGSLSYLPVANANGSAIVTVTVTDSGGSANGGVDHFSGSFTVNVTAVNDAPVLDPAAHPVLTAINEDDATSSGNSVAGIVAGGSITDADLPAGPVPSAIAVTAVDNTHGAWQFSTNNGASWSNFTATSGSIVNLAAARLLDGTLTGSATQRIRFVPAPDFNGSSSFTFRAWDKTTGSAGDTADISQTGGASAFSVATNTPGITIISVNDPPTLDPLPDLSINENALQQSVALTGITAGGGETQVLTVSATSSNPGLIPNPTIIYTSPGGTATLNFTPIAKTSGSVLITVTVQDDGAGANLVTRTFNVTVLSIPPLGAIETVSREAVTGVAFDADAGAASIQVRADIDGVAGTPFLADINRPDLTSYPVIGSPNHGFRFVMPHLSGAAHSVDVWVQDYPGTSFVKLGTRDIPAATDPLGAIESVGRDMVTGVAFDPNAQADPILVRVDIDGNVGTPFLADISRPDLTSYNLIGSPNHAFRFVMPHLTSAAHTVDVWIQDFPGATFVKLGSQQVPAISAPLGVIESMSRETIRGVAFDPNAEENPILVRLDIDGVAGTPFLADINRPELTAYNLIGSPNHGFIFAMPHVSSAAHTVDLWVQDYPGSGFIKAVSSLIPEAVLTGGGSFLVSLPNAAGPYQVVGSDSLTVSVDGVTGPPGKTGIYTWDVNGDGIFGDERFGSSTNYATSVTFSADQFKTLGMTPGIYDVRVQADDGKGLILNSDPALLAVKRLVYDATIWGNGYGAAFTRMFGSGYGYGLVNEVADKATTQATARALVGDIVYLDIENDTLQMDPRYIPAAEFQANMNTLIQIIQWMREVRPTMKIVLYGINIPIDYWDPLQAAIVGGPFYAEQLRLWENAIDQLRPLLPYVDAVCPSLYAYYNDGHPEYWQAYARTTILEAQKLGKPIIPFLMPFYHGDGVPPPNGAAGVPIQPDYWQSQLDLLARMNVDGVICFASRFDMDFDPNAYWYVALEKWQLQK
jgi:hypothetical protein